MTAQNVQTNYNISQDPTLRSATGNDRREVCRPLAQDDLLSAWGISATSRCLCHDLLLFLLLPDLLLRLGCSFEAPLRPPSRPSLKEVLDDELDAFAVQAALASHVHPALLQMAHALADLLDDCGTIRIRLQRVAHGHQQFAGTLNRMLLGHVFLVVAIRELATKLPNDLGRQQLPQEEVTDEPDVCSETVPSLIPQVFQLLLILGPCSAIAIHGR
mmetsp:Transcript_51109/g.128983  ORF Transcript_51109/g.128983 Transcript_51109/m.128983 type:complete len:216 (-) Transcript_51109:1486-2133(-)